MKNLIRWIGQEIYGLIISFLPQRKPPSKPDSRMLRSEYLSIA